MSAVRYAANFAGIFQNIFRNPTVFGFDFLNSCRRIHQKQFNQKFINSSFLGVMNQRVHAILESDPTAFSGVSLAAAFLAR